MIGFVYLGPVVQLDKLLNPPLHQECGQKPGQPGKAWPGQAFRVFGQVYRENVAW